MSNVMKINTLMTIGFTDYQLRSVFGGYNRKEEAYAWVEDTLVMDGVKKPKVNVEKFIDAYEDFRKRQLETEMNAIRDQLAKLKD